jgi:hypothetical protein
VQAEIARLSTHSAQGFVVIDDEDSRLLDTSDCAWRRAALGHDVLSRRAGSVN